MAHEHVLKILVGGIENTAGDFERLADMLNLRARIRGKRFTPAQYQSPRPPYPTKEESAARTVSFATTIADAYASAVEKFGDNPSSPAMLEGSDYDERGLLSLIASWQGLRAGVLKTILGTYGELATEPAPALLPGPASEERLWAELAAWFEKLAKDAISFVAVQRLPEVRDDSSGSRRSGRILELLALLEQSVHRASLNALLISGALPYHLYHTAQRGRRD